MFKKLFFGIGLVLAVLAVIGIVLPGEVTVKRSIEIHASPAIVFQNLNSFQQFNQWSPWAKIDPATKYTYSGPKHGVGHKMAWSSSHDEVGTGSQEIVESTPSSLVKTTLDFGEHGGGVATFTLTPQGEATSLTWDFHTDMGGGPAGGWLGLMMDSMLGPSYEKGLADLKLLVESKN
jgi:uncharacterized protein YndB with AHSA1/START domain